MTQPITLAQLSDIHLSPFSGFGPRYWNAKRALGYLNWQRSRRRVHTRAVADRLVADMKTMNPDHVAVTGDLINLGLPAEYIAAERWLRSVGTAENVTVIPGNHDIYTALRGDIGVLRWASYMGGDAATLTFPFVRRVGPLALIGLNSAVETPPFVAAGRLGAEQIDVAGDLLQRLRQDDVVRVVLIHHPPLAELATGRRGLTDAPQFARMLKTRGAELVLYGHNHRAHETWLMAESGAVPIIGAASASAGIAHGQEPLARYNLFTFFRHPEGWRIRQTVRGLAASGAAVGKLDERFLTPP
jgi:3',5'-cyclic AMP phosphodiesterase CpdA